MIIISRQSTPPVLSRTSGSHPSRCLYFSCLLKPVLAPLVSLTTARLQLNFGAGPIISQENVTARNSPLISPCWRKLQPCVGKRRKAAESTKLTDGAAVTQRGRGKNYKLLACQSH
ncbi:hypothetical protein PAMP_023193 [Pampus punctatissimus]